MNLGHGETPGEAEAGDTLIARIRPATVAIIINPHSTINPTTNADSPGLILRCDNTGSNNAIATRPTGSVTMTARSQKMNFGHGETAAEAGGAL